MLVFVTADQHLSASDEKAVYDLHQNTPDDPGYRRFLSRLTVPLAKQLSEGACGLDYGCGPGPTLSVMMREQKFNMADYDPIYANLENLLADQYDFITCTEVVEHFRNPHDEFKRLFSLLKQRGRLGIMTKQVIDKQAFSRWHYKNDLTHISFFSRSTFFWLADHYQRRVEFFQNDVVILQPV